MIRCGCCGIRLRCRGLRGGGGGIGLIGSRLRCACSRLSRSGGRCGCCDALRRAPIHSVNSLAIILYGGAEIGNLLVDWRNLIVHGLDHETLFCASGHEHGKG